MSILPVVYQPKARNTLTEYLQNYSTAELISIFENPEELNGFSAILLKTPWSRKKSMKTFNTAFQNLCTLLGKTENNNELLLHIMRWESARHLALEKLSKYSNFLNKVSKLCNVLRIIGYSTEILYTITGLYLSSTLDDICVSMLISFTHVGVIISLCQITIFNLTSLKLLKFLRKDRNLILPITKQSKKVKDAMLNVLPWDYTDYIVKEFIDVVEEEREFDPVSLLSCLLKYLYEKITKDKRNKDETNEETIDKHNRMIIQILVEFMSHPSFKEICEWIFFHQTCYDLKSKDLVAVVICYNISPFTFYIYQFVRNFRNQYLVSAMGRLFLSGCFILTDLSQYFKFPRYYDLKNVEHHYKKELDALNRIRRTLEEKRINK